MLIHRVKYYREKIKRKKYGRGKPEFSYFSFYDVCIERFLWAIKKNHKHYSRIRFIRFRLWCIECLLKLLQEALKCSHL